MPRYKSVQCKAQIIGNERQCKRRTIVRSPYCYQHTPSKLGVQVADSKIEGAGKGLFAARDIQAGERIIEYKGQRTTTAPPNTHDYVTSVKQDNVTTWIDAEDPTKSSVARYMNDCRKKTKGCTKNNAYLYQWTKPSSDKRKEQNKPKHRARMYVKARESIPKGAEIYISYGTQYWNENAKRVKEKGK